MEYIELGRTGFKVSMIGLGTWGFGGFSSRDDRLDQEQISTLRESSRMGITFIDTAEMYARGHSEELVGEAFKENREEVFIATKVSPEHLSYEQVQKSAESSLSRLKTRTIDLYQVHWPNPRIPIRETMRGMERLVKDGKVRFIGVSNFSLEEMNEAQESLAREEIVSNQVEYSLLHRNTENDLLPHCQKEKITVIAYSPLARGRISQGVASRGEGWETLMRLSTKLGKTLPQIALNWLICHRNVLPIPKASRIEHLEENADSTGWRLSDGDYGLISRAFS